MTAKIACVGGAVIDLIYGVERLPSIDGKLHALSYMESGGGMAANAAVIIQRLGGKALWCGRLGDDDKGRRIRDDLQSEHVDVHLTRIIPGVQSSHSIVLVDRDGNRAIVLYRSDSLDADPSWLPMADITSGDAVLADNRWVPGAVAVLSAARAKGIPAILDADEAGDQSSLAAVAAASHVIFSAAGLCDLFDTVDPAEGLRLAAKHAPFVAVTMGGDGVIWMDQTGAPRRLPAFSVAARETVGAGDIFHGAFALALVEGRTEEQALQFAAAVAAIKCTREGGRSSFPFRPEVIDFLDQHRATELSTYQHGARQ